MSEWSLMERREFIVRDAWKLSYGRARRLWIEFQRRRGCDPIICPAKIF